MNNRIKSILYSLLALPMVAAFVAFFIVPFVKAFLRSFQHFDALSTPTQAGLEKYKNLIGNDVFIIIFQNTVILIFMVSVVAGTLAFLLSRLLRHLPFALRIVLPFSFCTLSAVIYTGGVPIDNINAYSSVFSLALLISVVVFGPLLTILVFIPDAKKKSLLMPFSFSPAIYVAALSPAVLTLLCGLCSMQTFGFPTAGYKADTLQTLIYDYIAFKFDFGTGASAKIIMFILLLVLYALFFGLIFLVMFIFSKFVKVAGIKQPANKHFPAAIAVSVILSVCALSALVYVIIKNDNKTFAGNLYEQPLSEKLSAMILLPALPSFLAVAIAALAAFGLAKANSVAAKIIICIAAGILPLSVITLIVEISPQWIINAPFLQAFLCVFSSAIFPLTFLYLSVVISRAKELLQNPIPAVFKNTVPVLGLSFIGCFITPLTQMLNYEARTTHFSIYGVRSWNTSHFGILTLMFVAFIAVSFLSAALLFPQEKTTVPSISV